MTTVSRRAVQDEYVSRESVLHAIHSHRLTMDGRAASHMLDDIFATVLELPSSNAQAVAWQCRPAISYTTGKRYAEEENPWEWRDCTEQEMRENSYAGAPVGEYEFRALCICSGDAKEA